MIKNKGLAVVISVLSANFFLGFGLNFFLFSWFDILLHFLGGLGVYLILAQHFRIDLFSFSWFKRSIFLIGTAALVGILWEFAEYSTTALPAILPLPWDGLSFIGDLPDTLSDLALDIFGALLGSILHFFRQRQSQQFQNLAQNHNKNAR